MKRPTQLLVLAIATFLGAGAAAQTVTTSQAAPASKEDPLAVSHVSVSAADIQALKEGLAAAQKEIQVLRDELHRRDQVVQQAQTDAAAASAKADAVQVQAVKASQQVNALENDLADLKSVNFSTSSSPALQNAVLNMQEATPGSGQPQAEVFNKQMESSITIRFRGINITPGGYAAAEFVRRSRALSADITTPFNSVPMPGASQTHMSDFFGSGRQSKVTTFVDGRLGKADLSSYISGDFLSAGVTSTSNSTNSYTLRLRQAWAQVKFTNGFAFLGGQTWSLVTENAKGIAPDDDMGKTNDVRPRTIDQYTVGFDYARQWGIRVTQTFNNKVAVAFALENPQATLTTHGNAGNYLVGQPGDGKTYNSLTTYSFNPAPDMIAKIAFDPVFGHYEVFGVVSRFTDRIFPCVETGDTRCPTGGTGAAGAFNASKEGGGVGASARWVFFKHLTFGLKGFGGNGVGRYGNGALSDASINPDGTIHLIRNLHGLSTLEYRTKKLTLYTYGGVEYAGRTYNWDPLANKGAGANVGYGAPTFTNTACYTEVAPGSGGFSPGSLGSNCTADTRALIEGTAGFWYKFYTGPRGEFRYGIQYSYLTRNTWSGNGGLPSGSGGLQPGGIDNMVFSSFRYYLP
jgi:hypothetical protein